MSTFREFVATLPPDVREQPSQHFVLYERYLQNEQIAFHMLTRRDELEALFWNIVAMLHAQNFDLDDLRAVARSAAGLTLFPLNTPPYLLPPGHERGF